MWFIAICSIVILGFLGGVDAMRFGTGAWDSVRLHRGATVFGLFAVAVFWVLWPVTVYYWVFLRRRLNAFPAR